MLYVKYSKQLLVIDNYLRFFYQDFMLNFIVKNIITTFVEPKLNGKTIYDYLWCKKFEKLGEKKSFTVNSLKSIDARLLWISLVSLSHK